MRSPDSKLAYLPGGGSNTVDAWYIFPTEDVRKPLLTVPTGAYPNLIGFDSAAKLIYAQNGEFNLLVYNMNLVKLHEDLPTDAWLPQNLPVPRRDSRPGTGNIRQLVAIRVGENFWRRERTEWCFLSSLP